MYTISKCWKKPRIRWIPEHCQLTVLYDIIITRYFLRLGLTENVILIFLYKFNYYWFKIRNRIKIWRTILGNDFETKLGFIVFLYNLYLKFFEDKINLWIILKSRNKIWAHWNQGIASWQPGLLASSPFSSEMGKISLRV